MSVGYHSTLIGGGKGEGSLFCSDAHKIVASVVNVLTRIVANAQSQVNERFCPRNFEIKNGRFFFVKSTELY